MTGLVAFFFVVAFLILGLGALLLGILAAFPELIAQQGDRREHIYAGPPSRDRVVGGVSPRPVDHGEPDARVTPDDLARLRQLDADRVPEQ